MKIDVPSCFVVGWLCALPQDWPSGRGHPPLLSARRIGRPSAVGRLGRSSRHGDVWTTSVIFPKDVQSDNPSTDMS
jgi:hypothetical protein